MFSAGEAAGLGDEGSCGWGRDQEHGTASAEQDVWAGQSRLKSKQDVRSLTSS